MQSWKQAQIWESTWWGNCVNSLNEERKQLVYAKKMGLVLSANEKTPYQINMQNASILDVGGGPVSILLKCVNLKGKVIDPIKFPVWVYKRYECANIDYEIIKAEDMNEQDWDEVWIYNVLQHCENTKKVIINCQKAAKIIRIFEWIDTPSNIGHPNSLSEKQLNEWLRGEGKVEIINQNGCKGKAYYGIFPTD